MLQSFKLRNVPEIRNFGKPKKARKFVAMLSLRFAQWQQKSE
jgi:hypothetical protein